VFGGGGVEGVAGADDRDPFRTARLAALVADTRKLCGRAADLAPAAAEPRVLAIWAHMVAANVSGAVALCGAQGLVKCTTGGGDGASGHARRGGGGGGESPLPEAPEIWILAGRALHLSGLVADAKAVLNKAIACNLKARPPAALDASLALAAPAPAQALVDAIRTTSELSDRDVQRLVRECRYELALIQRLSATLQSAPRLALHSKFDRLFQVWPGHAPPCQCLLSRGYTAASGCCAIQALPFGDEVRS
jgi:hypothetical protein